MTRLQITTCELTFIAETQDQAPWTVAAFLDLLHYHSELVHVRWSGEGCWIPLGNADYGIPWENPTSYPFPGDFLFHPGGYSETEIIMAYGPCCFASKLGQLGGNHFLSIVEGRAQLPTLGERCLWEGAQAVRFEHAS